MDWAEASLKLWARIGAIGSWQRPDILAVLKVWWRNMAIGCAPLPRREQRGVVGTALIAVGVIVNLSPARRHVRLVRELDQASPHGLVL